ncbi:MAG: hypothetical protein FD153_1688 [Rhodospirillaceae bacterium]|nr:MAG: hypothetical protein FD153_1688 [Rhodospirillaceae bacterium]
MHDFTINWQNVARFGGMIGVGLTFSSNDGHWDIGLNYDAELKSSFVGHPGQIEERYSF